MAKEFQKRYIAKQGIVGPVSGTYEFLQITKTGVVRFSKKKILTLKN